MHLLLYHTFHKRQCAQCVSSDKHGETCFECCKYKGNQRPLIDVVRHTLQDLREGAAQIDREKTLHLELTPEGSVARSNMLLKMMGDVEEETKSPDASAVESSLQGSNNTTASSVEIEMGRVASSGGGDRSSSSSDAFEGDDREREIVETPLKI